MSNASSRMRIAAVCVAGFALLATAACTTSDREAPSPARIMAAPRPMEPKVSGPLLVADGTCTEPSAGTAAAIEPGIGECDLVRLKAKPPTDVLIGEGRSGREVQVLYSEPGAKELYFFVNGRLDRIVKS